MVNIQFHYAELINHFKAVFSARLPCIRTTSQRLLVLMAFLHVCINSLQPVYHLVINVYDCWLGSVLNGFLNSHHLLRSTTKQSIIKNKATLLRNWGASAGWLNTWMSSLKLRMRAPALPKANSNTNRTDPYQPPFWLVLLHPLYPVGILRPV